MYSFLWLEVVAEGEKSLPRFEVNHIPVRVANDYK
jgi:hypothetical protein